jgi:hypothetical protein
MSKGTRIALNFNMGNIYIALKCNKKIGKLTLPLGLPFTLKSFFNLKHCYLQSEFLKLNMGIYC